MKKEKINKLFKQADSDLEKSINELNKPEEDVVAFSACTYARSALYHFLSCLHTLKNDEVTLEKESNTLDDLIDLVSEEFEEVGELDFSPIGCTHRSLDAVLSDEEIAVCNNVHQLNVCTDRAKAVKEIVVDKIYYGEEPDFASHSKLNFR